MANPLRIQVAGFRGAWAASTFYRVNEIVLQSGAAYAALATHTSGSSFTAAPNWASLTGPAGSTGPRGDVAIPVSFDDPVIVGVGDRPLKILSRYNGWAINFQLVSATAPGGTSIIVACMVNTGSSWVQRATATLTVGATSTSTVVVSPVVATNNLVRFDVTQEDSGGACTGLTADAYLIAP